MWLNTKRPEYGGYQQRYMGRDRQKSDGISGRSRSTRFRLPNCIGTSLTLSSASCPSRHPTAPMAVRIPSGSEPAASSLQVETMKAIANNATTSTLRSSCRVQCAVVGDFLTLRLPRQGNCAHHGLSCHPVASLALPISTFERSAQIALLFQIFKEEWKQ